ncbi:MAG: nucleotide exchange factor GrpE [bacterium]
MKKDDERKNLKDQEPGMEQKQNQAVNEDIEVEETKEEQNLDEPESKEDEEQDEQPSKETLLEKELNEYKDKYIRLSAEFDNFRKRSLKEKIELTKTAGEDMILKLLPVMDDFERALHNIGKAQDVESLTQGVELIFLKFKDLLNQKGVKEIEAMNQDFDMDVHEAITKIPAPEEKLKGKIVDVIEKGYMMNDKIIRYPKVVVGE